MWHRGVWWTRRVCCLAVEHQPRDFSRVRTSKRSLSTKNILSWYSNKLETHPLLIKGVTSGLISGAGDFICQSLTTSNDDDAHDNDAAQETWDVSRTFRFIAMGSLWVAPVTHFWYNALSTRILSGPRTTLRVVQRLIVDQFGFAPLFAPSFMAGLWILEGREDIVKPLIELSPSLVVANWTLWIPAQLVNFGMVPLKYQVLFGNVVALGWSVYLSFVSARSGQKSAVTDHSTTP